MKLIIESTSKLVVVDGVPARIWEGHTDTGIPVHCFVTRVAAQIERELQEHRAPSIANGYPLRMLL